MTATASSRASPTARAVPVFTGAACNDGCSFCRCAALPSADAPDGEALREAIDAAARGGASAVVFHGGEPTLRPDLLALARHARRRGLAVGLVTNARRLAYERLADALVRRGGLSFAEVALHGDAGTHDRLVRDTSHAQVVAGIGHLLARGVDVRVRCTVTAGNLGALRGVVDQVAHWRGVALDLSLPEGEEPSAHHARSDDVRLAVADAHAHWATLPVDRRPPLSADGIPTCLAGELAVAPRPDTPSRMKPPVCAGCAARERCPGISVGGWRAVGGDGLRPQADAGAPGVRGGGSLRGVPIADGAVLAETARLDIAPRFPDAALVTLIVPSCDLGCVFCAAGAPEGAAGPPPRPSSEASVRRGLRAMAGRARDVFFTGGEPTRLPWLVAALAEARALGYRNIQMQTHAGAAADPAFADALVGAGLTAVDVPIYGPDAAIHEAITATAGSFERTHAGLRALRDRGVRAVVHTTLFRSNLPALGPTLAHLDALEPDAIYVQVCGALGPAGFWRSVTPTLTEAAHALLGALDACPPRAPVTVADIPPCLLPGHEDRVPSWRGPPAPDPGVVVLPYSEWLAVFSAGETRVHGAACASCVLQGGCDGVPREVFDAEGEAPLRPRR